MHRLFSIALFLIAASALSTGASAQNAYKCGNSYSQTPCPDAVPVDAGDKRTSAQKMQADAATARTAQTANAMEKDRLTLEKKAPTASKGTTADLSPPTNETPPQAGRNKKKAPAYFTAQVPGEKKVKKKIAKAAKATKAKKEAARNP